MNMKYWDIFCTVVDNFGDIGISWRLARQLAAEHGLSVRLWVDDLASFKQLCPEIDPALSVQTQRGVDIRWLTAEAPFNAVADVVIEAFGCELPESYLAAMAARTPAPVWINLEYLSAEPWVVGCHGLASPHPRLPLKKYFFFPGFVKGTGGLLREAQLAARRDACQGDSNAAWASLGLPEPASKETSVSLFAYRNPALPELLNTWAQGPDPTRCLISPGPLLAQATEWLGRELVCGEMGQRGRLCVHALPFFEQEHYDRLLWACDLNFVRGEDSFVRALWAARPMVWQPYQQPEQAHLAKLGAFLDVYCRNLAPDAAAACRGMFQAWNGQPAVSPDSAWGEYRRHWPALTAHARRFTQELSELPELAGDLVRFCQNRYNL